MHRRMRINAVFIRSYSALLQYMIYRVARKQLYRVFITILADIRS